MSQEVPKIQLWSVKWVGGRDPYDRRRMAWYPYAGELVKEAECCISDDGNIELLEELHISKGEWMLCLPSLGNFSFVALREMSLDKIGTGKMPKEEK